MALALVRFEARLHHDAAHELVLLLDLKEVLDLPRRIAAQELDSERSGCGQERMHDQRRFVRILELEIELTVHHRGVQTKRRVTARAAVTAPLKHLETAENSRRMQRAGHLTHAAADTRLELVGYDLRGVGEA